MARKSKASSNPIRVVRLQNHKTLEEFASECGVHLQAVFLNEKGMYPTVLPSIMTRLSGHYGCDPISTEEAYQFYVRTKRETFGNNHQPYVLNEPTLGICPLGDFRHSLGYSTIFGFSEAIAINPTPIRRVEGCKTDLFPAALKQALRDIQLPADDIEELEYRHQEYYHSGLRLNSRS
jgi:DNA-binding XRE family transcriptional regulator